MDDIRTSFDEAVTSFREFLRSQGWSDDLCWLARERLTGHRCRYWVLRPEELTSDSASRRFYEAARQGSGSIRLDGLAQVNGKTLCYVENYGGGSKMLNFGVRQGPLEMKTVSSTFRWALLVIMNWIRGESPFLKETDITTIAEPRAARYRRIRAET
jgi:hypothetical protein